MTDGRIAGQWIGSPEYDDFGIEAWGLFTRAIAWSNEQGTDGAILTRYLGVIFPWEKGLEEACAELVKRGKLLKTENGYQLLRWSEDARAGGLGQESAARVAELREQRRVRAKRSRDRKRDPEPIARDITRDVTHDVTHRVGQEEEEEEEEDRKGQERTGKDRLINSGSKSTVGTHPPEPVFRDGNDIYPIPEGSPMALVASIRSDLEEQDARSTAASAQPRDQRENVHAYGASLLREYGNNWE